MLQAQDMTQFQKVTTGLKIFEEYLSPKDNPGEIECMTNVLRVRGVHREALGGNDRVKLEAMGWQWHEKRQHWWIAA
jgi:hypothetical protein